MTTTRKTSLKRGTALTVAGIGTAVLLAAAAPAMARGGDAFGEKCGSTADTEWQTIGAVSQKLETEGYTDFLRITRDDGCYEVVARKADERPMKLWLNPASLEVTGFSKIPPKAFRGHMGKGHHGKKGGQMQGGMMQGGMMQGGMKGGQMQDGAPMMEQPPQPQDN